MILSEKRQVNSTFNMDAGIVHCCSYFLKFLDPGDEELYPTPKGSAWCEHIIFCVEINSRHNMFISSQVNSP